MTCGQKTKSRNRSSTVTTSIKTLNMVHIKKKKIWKRVSRSQSPYVMCVCRPLCAPLGHPWTSSASLSGILGSLSQPGPFSSSNTPSLLISDFFCSPFPPLEGSSLMEAWFVWDFQCWKRFWKTGMSRLPSAEFTPSLHSDACLNVCVSNWAFPNPPLKSHPQRPLYPCSPLDCSPSYFSCPVAM